MIKVMHVISDTNIGGAGKYLITICQNIDKDKFQISVVLPKGSLLIPELKETGVNLIEVDGMKDDSKDAKAIKMLKKIIDDNKPDIVHTHASIVARIAGRKSKSKPKIVYTKHCDFEVSKIYNNLIVRKLFGAFTKRYADMVIATSNHSKENLIKQGIKEDMILAIPNGTKGYNTLPEENKKKIRMKYNLTNEFVIGYIARLVELKGHLYLLESVKYLKDNYPNFNFKCMLIGSGEFEEKIKEKIEELDIKDKVILTGFVKDIESIVNILDIQVNCSYLSETTNLALLEGMSIGVPSVATDIGGTPDMIEQNVNGSVVHIKDAEAMAKEIYRIYADKDLYTKMRENSIKIFKEKYTEDKFVRNIEKVYENVLS